MGNYVLSQTAEKDIRQIARTSIENWGLVRTERYILGLNETFERLAKYPDLGRKVDVIRPGYLQTASGTHAICYRKTETGILIMRVLHQHMDVMRHL